MIQVNKKNDFTLYQHGIKAKFDPLFSVQPTYVKQSTILPIWPTSIPTRVNPQLLPPFYPN